LAACWLHSAVVAQGNWPVSAALAMPGTQAIKSIKAVIIGFLWVSLFPASRRRQARTESAQIVFLPGRRCCRSQSDRRPSF
jgi:hypothetical protein